MLNYSVAELRFNSQVEQYVNTEDCKVAVLNAFPIFLFDYFK